MSKREAKRLTVIEQVLEKQITQKRAAELLGLSVPRIKVLCRAVRNQGAQAVVHGNVGRAPAHTVSAQVCAYVVDLYRQWYSDFNFSHFTEKLVQEHSLDLSRPTVHRILKEAGISSSRKKRKTKCHHRRQPRSRAGELVQLDASRHDWFENGGYCHLHGAIDDAQSELLSLWFSVEEITESYCELIRQMNADGKLPLAFYTDKRGVFTNNRSEEQLSIAEQLAGVNPSQTQFSRAMGELGITIILAGSAEAKGRVERLWGTLQDRLVKDMRMANIHSLDEANAWLPSYIKEHNKRFARKAADTIPAYRAKVPQKELEEILCQHFERKLDHGLSFSYDNRVFVLPDRYRGKSIIAHARQTITVLDSPRFGIKSRLIIDGESVVVTPKEIVKLSKQEPVQRKSLYTTEQRSANGKIGAANSPWSTYHGPRSVH